MATRNVRLIDSTLRDGSHAMAHQFTSEMVRDIVKALDDAGVDTLEISHGDGLGGSSFNYGFSKEPETNLLKVAAETVQNTKLAVLLLPGIGTRKDLQRRCRVWRQGRSYRDPLYGGRHLAAAHCHG